MNVMRPTIVLGSFNSKPTAYQFSPEFGCSTVSVGQIMGHTMDPTMGHTMDPTMVNHGMFHGTHGKNVPHEMDHGTVVSVHGDVYGTIHGRSH